MSKLDLLKMLGIIVVTNNRLNGNFNFDKIEITADDFFFIVLSSINIIDALSLINLLFFKILLRIFLFCNATNLK